MKKVDKKDTKKKNNSQKNKLLEDKILIVLIIILIALALFLIISYIVRGRNLNTESDQVNELHNYFSTDDLTNCNGLFNYTNKKVTNEDVSVETKLCIAYQKTNKEKVETETLKREGKSETCQNADGMIFRITEDTDECQVSKIDKNLLDETYLKIFGQDISNNEEFRADNTHICYLKDNKYYCGLSETFSYVIGNESTIYRVLEKAVKKGSEIYLYDYFAKITNSTCYKDYTPSTINQDCTSNYKENKVNYKFMEKYATKYKHTYRKGENGNYYWVSSEPVTEE